MASVLSKNGFYYLAIISTLAFITLIFFLTGSYYTVKNKIYNKTSNRLGYILLISSFVVIFGTYIIFFQLDNDVPEELNLNTVEDSDLIEANHCNMKIDKENETVVKKLKPIIIKSGDNYKKNYDFLLSISNFTKNNKNGKVALIDIFLYSIILNYHWESIKFRENLSEESPFFTKTYEVDQNNFSWKEDYIPYSLDGYEKLDKEKIKRQLLQLDLYLKKKGLYLSDVHKDNIRIDKTGNIKVIDGEIFTENSFKYLKNLRVVNTLEKKLPMMERLYTNKTSMIPYYI